MLYRLFFSIGAISAFYSSITPASGKSILEFLYFGNCKDSDKTAFFHLENTQYGMAAADASEFNTTIVITKDLDVVDLKVKAYKCKSASEADCELFMRVPVPDCCWRLREKGQYYSVFAENANPPISCPFKKNQQGDADVCLSKFDIPGTHRVTHARVNVNIVDALMEDNVIYLVKFVDDFHGTYAGCLMAKVKKTRLRARKNIKSGK